MSQCGWPTGTQAQAALAPNMGSTAALPADIRAEETAAPPGQRGLPAAVVLLAIHAALLAYSAPRQAPTVDEPFHLAAGIEHWQLGRFTIDRGNPPLAGSVAALPVLLAKPQVDFRRAPNSYGVGSDFVAANGPRFFWLTALGRLACIPWSLLGAWICFVWGRALYGPAAGLAALALWCFCPNMLAHGQLITADMAATAMGVTAFYGFWRWLKSPTLGRAVLAGILLGLAELTKFVWLVAYPLWVGLWLVCRWGAGPLARRRFFTEAAHIALIVFVSMDVINLGYAFEGPWQSLDSYHAGRKMLATLGSRSALIKPLGAVPIPLPANYMRGIDEIVRLGEGRPWTYLDGVRRNGGWWYFYPYALLLKVPVGTLVWLQLGGVLCLLRHYRAGWREELFLVVPVMGLLALVQSSGTSQVFRYALPMLPFAFLWASKAARSIALGDRAISGLATVCLAASVASSLWTYPHSLSYFNALAGGPQRGHRHLINSDIDWGQDLLYLKRWLDAHPEARPLRLAYFGRVDPLLAGIEYTLPPKGSAGHIPRTADPRAQGPTPPGWYAISVNLLCGFGWAVPNGRGHVEWVAGPEYQHFLSYTPTAMAGYSIYIYHIGQGQRQ